MPASIKLKLNLTTINQLLDQNAPKRMLEATNELRTVVLETLSRKPKADPSRIYRVPGTKKLYQASSPGDPPATATSDLKKSVKSSVEGRGRSVLGKVKADAKHALPLEFGHRQGGKHVAARPFMKPSFDKSLPVIRFILTRKWF